MWVGWVRGDRFSSNVSAPTQTGGMSNGAGSIFGSARLGKVTENLLDQITRFSSVLLHLLDSAERVGDTAPTMVLKHIEITPPPIWLSFSENYSPLRFLKFEKYHHHPRSQQKFTLPREFFFVFSGNYHPPPDL